MLSYKGLIQIYLGKYRAMLFSISLSMLAQRKKNHFSQNVY